jgi:hypothetical protein
MGKLRERDRIKSILTDQVYEVKMINDWSVVLESLDGVSQIWTEKNNLNLFYKKIEEERNLRNLGPPSGVAKKLRHPRYVSLDFL